MRARLTAHLDTRINAIGVNDRPVAYALGMIAAGCLLLLWAASQVDARLARLNPLKETHHPGGIAP